MDGLQQLLMRIPAESPVKTVCIGGINASNASRVVWQSAAPPPPLPPSATSTTRGRALDGIAVVSAVVAAADPEAAARELRALVSAAPAFAAPSPSDDSSSSSISSIGDNDALASKLLPTLMPELVGAVDAQGPLSHNMTNLVVQNLAANVALACGASPIMANYGEEAGDLAALGGALVVNMGTVTPDGLANYLQALRAYNARGRPVVFDPVG